MSLLELVLLSFLAVGRVPQITKVHRVPFKFLLLYYDIILGNSDLKYSHALKLKFTVFKFWFVILFVSVLHFLQKSLTEISEENRQVLLTCWHACAYVSLHMSLYRDFFKDYLPNYACAIQGR